MPETPSPKPEVSPEAPRRRIWRRVFTGGLILVVAAALTAWWNPSLVLSVVRLVRGDDTDPEQRRQVLEKIEVQDNAPAVNPADQDAEFRRKMLGRWTQSRSDAERVLILNEDGTALQIILPKGWAATSYLGDRVELDVVWKVKDGRAIFDSVGGRPADMARRVNDLFGTHRNRRIVEITDEHILLFDEQDNEPTKWRRAPDESGDSAGSAEQSQD